MEPTNQLLPVVTLRKVKRKPSMRQLKAISNVVENGGNVTKAMRDAGYPESTVNNPGVLTNSKTWAELMEKHLPDDVLSQKHAELLNATRLDHMVFPLEKPELTDAHITEMLAEVNCTVRKIVHSETSRHVYFWALDNKSRKDALELAYKIKGKMAPEIAPPGGNTYNFFYKPDIRALGEKYEAELEATIEKNNVQKD